MHYKSIYKDFMGRQRCIPVLERLINYIRKEIFMDKILSLCTVFSQNLSVNLKAYWTCHKISYLEL